MTIENLGAKIGYPCILCKTTEEAAGHLIRLITTKQCGFEEGTRVWTSALQEFLTGHRDLLDLNASGATFSAEEWKTILIRVLDGLEKGFHQSKQLALRGYDALLAMGETKSSN